MNTHEFSVDFYASSCSSTGTVSCGPITPSTLSVAGGGVDTVEVTYSVGAAAGSSLTLTLFYIDDGGPELRRSDKGGGAVEAGRASVSGTQTINVVHALPPVVSLTPYNDHRKDLSSCVASCFELSLAHTSPAYYSLDMPRALTLGFASGTARPTLVIQFDVAHGGGAAAMTYKVEVRRASNNTLLTLLNGQTSAYYTASGGTTRLAAAFDAEANGLPTGGHNVNLTVTTNVASGSPVSTTLPTRVLVVDRSASPFGPGWWPAGLQQVYPGPTSTSKMVAEGDGSAWYYGPNTCCSYITPTGTFAVLTSNSTAGWFRRTYPDGSYVEFNYTTGRMTKAVDRFGNTTTYNWNGSGQLTSIVDPMSKQLTLTYHASNGLMASVTDPGSRQTTYAYDGSNRLWRITDPDTYYTTFGYTGDLVNQVTDRAGRTMDYTFDALNRLATVAAPAFVTFEGLSQRPTVTQLSADNVVWQPGVAGTVGAPKAVFTSDTLRASITDPLGAVARAKLDAAGAATQLTDVLNQATSITRDGHGRPTLVTQPNGHQTQYTYSGHLLTQTADLTTGRTVNYAYQNARDLITMSGDVVRMDYIYYNGSDGGPSGALKQVYRGNTGAYPPASASDLEATYLVDSRGRVTGTVDKQGGVTSALFDATWGNSLRSTSPRGAVDSVHYDALGRVDTSFVPTSGKWVTKYGLLNQVVKSVNPLLQADSTVYNPDLSVARIIDRKGQVYKFGYNAAGALAATFGLADTTKADSVWYDRAGRARTIRNRRGNVISQTYDAVGRVLTRSGPDFPTDTYRYDAAGRWAVATNSVSYDSLHYDTAGRLSRAFSNQGGPTWEWRYTYDIQNRLTLREDPLSQYRARLRYTAAHGLVDSVCAATVCAGLAYEDHRRLEGYGFNSGTVQQWGLRYLYEDGLPTPASDEFQHVGASSAPSTPLSYWGRDSVGRVISRRPDEALNAQNERGFDFDELGRLLLACDNQPGGGCTTLASHTYDAASNRQDTGANTVIGSGNRLEATGCWEYQYDLDGNRTQRLRRAGCTFLPGTTYTWDAMGRLTSVQTNSNTTTFVYDAMGRRIAKTANGVTQRYLYDGDAIVLDLDASHQPTTEYGYRGLDQLFAMRTMSSPTFTAAAIIDPTNGSLRQLRSSQGGWPIKKYPHSVWGETSADTGAMVRMRYAGREYDAETGLYFMRARYYDPAVGRFISEDPIGIGGGMNLYAYAGSDPVNGRDPFGLDPDCPDGPKCKAQPLPDLDVPGERPPIGPPAMDDPFERREAFEEHEYGHLRPRETPAPIGNDCRAEAKNLAQNAAIDLVGAATGGLGGLAIRRGGRLLNRVSGAQFAAGHVGLSQLTAMKGESLIRTGGRLRGLVGAIGFGSFAADFHDGDVLGMLGGIIDFGIHAAIDITPGAGTIIAGGQLLICLTSKPGT